MNNRFHSMKKLFACLSLTVICISTYGCGSSNSGPSEADLVRRQQQQETAAALKTKTADERIENARKFLAEDNVVGARAELRPLLANGDSNSELIILNSECEAADGNLQSASRLIDAVDRSDWDSATKALFLKATWLSQLNDFESAEAALREVLEVRQQSPDATDNADVHVDVIRAHHGLATLLNNQGQRISAANHLRFLAEHGEIQEKELIAMISYSDPFIDMSARKPNFESMGPAALALAKQHRFERDLPAALKLIEDLAQRHPDFAPISAFQGRVYAELLDESKLRSWVSKLPAGIESEPEYWFARAITAQQQNQHREAVRMFMEAVIRDPTDRYSYFAMSRSLAQLDMSDVAQKANERFKLLDDTVRLAAKLGSEPGTREQHNRMSNSLRDLQRPVEAIAWQMVSLKRFRGSEDAIERLTRERKSLLATSTSEPDEAVLTCGLVRSDWPLPTSPTSVDPLNAESANTTRITGDTSSLRPIQLVNVAKKVTLDFQYDNGDDPNDKTVLLHQLTGGGIGIIDLELDGWPDLYLTQGGGAAFDAEGSKPNVLFRNVEGNNFIDVTSASACGDRGYGQGCAVADLNQDGFPDLVVANIGPNRMYINQGDGTFQQREFVATQFNGNWTTSIAVGDLNGDALPEIVEVNYVDDPTALTNPCTSTGTRCNPSAFQAAADAMWSMTEEGRIVGNDDLWKGGSQRGYGFAAVITNFDGEAGNDLFVANDTIENFYWLGQRESESSPYQLAESAKLYGCALGMLGQRQGCMGVAFGDFDRNARLDLHVTNFWSEPADLYLQRDNGFFVHASQSLGIAEPSRNTVAWGTQAADFDRNGWLDIAVLNGHVVDRRDKGEPWQMRPQMFRGEANQFQLMTADSDVDEYWNEPTLGRTLALLDWNRDLKPDMVANHLDMPVALLENQTESGNGLQIEVMGCTSERDAIGAQVTVHCGSAQWSQWVVGGDGFLCSNEAMLDFGLGSVETIDSLEVLWPSGNQQIFEGIVPNHRYLLIENEEQAFRRSE